MKKIIVGFTTPRKFKPLSWLIKKVERSEFSHTILITYINGTPLVFQANHNNVNAVVLDKFLENNEIVETVSIDLSDEDFQELTAIILNELGMHYGYFTLFGILLARLFKIPNIFRDKEKSYICSEFVARALSHFFKIDMDFETDGPKKLFKELKKC